MNDAESSRCPQCGAALPANAPAGLCPKCLMAMNLKTETLFTDPSSAQPPLPPEQIAPFFPSLEILACLGRGGMGVVYQARQKSLNRLVALKLLAPERVPDPKFAERFAREAQALAALNHPNIVTIYDFGQTGGFYYLLMEFVDGVNLRQLLRARKFTPEEALAIVPPLCDALQFAHDRGIVHRDIKPENLLLDKNGRVKVADFGLAKMLGQTAAPGELAHSAAGTPGYSAPEQRSDPKRVDNRADIYSLGVVFYEMLTGELPGKPIERPSRKVQIDVRLDEVVLRALEQKPEQRYSQASVLKTQVETIAQTAAWPPTPPIASQKPASSPQPDYFWRRFAIVSGCILLCLILLPVFIVGLGMFLPAISKNRQKANEPAYVASATSQIPASGDPYIQQTPVVVETFPVSGARGVEPGEREIRVRFSKTMTDNSWSWSSAWENSEPESIGHPHYEADGKTCVLKVKLEPGKTYAYWLNSGKFTNFKDTDGRSAVPYLLSFQTKAAQPDAKASSSNTNAPQIISVSPPDGATNVDVSQEIRIRFDRPMNTNKFEIRWSSGGFVSSKPLKYDADRNEFILPVQLLPGQTNELRINGNERGFGALLGADNVPLGKGLTWSFVTQPREIKPDAPKPRVVSVSTDSGITGTPSANSPIISLVSNAKGPLPVFTVLKIAFDQPMMPPSEKCGFPYLLKKGGGDHLPSLVDSFDYEPATHQFTVPLILPPDNDVRLVLDGFFSADGVASAPVTLRCQSGTNDFSHEYRDSMAAAAKDPRLEKLLTDMKTARESLHSGVEKIDIAYTMRADGRFFSVNAKTFTYKWQGTNQAYADLSSEFDGGPWRFGTDGQTGWTYSEMRGETNFQSSPTKYMNVDLTLADPFNLAGNSVAKAIQDRNLVYLGRKNLDGHDCHRVQSLTVRQVKNGYYPVESQKTDWWIDAQTLLPVQVAVSGGPTFRYQYEKLNQHLPESDFQPPQNITPTPPEKPGFVLFKDAKPPEGQTRYLRISDGSNGYISARIGRHDKDGDTNSGMN